MTECGPCWVFRTQGMGRGCGGACAQTPESTILSALTGKVIMYSGCMPDVDEPLYQNCPIGQGMLDENGSAQITAHTEGEPTFVRAYDADMEVIWQDAILPQPQPRWRVGDTMTYTITIPSS